ncbi:MAG: monovalent cation/H+ antiporter subunit D [Hyphomicrobiaceae bacterium]
MNHLPILPFLIPFVAAILLLLAGRAGLAFKRALTLASILLLIVVAVLLLMRASEGAILIYRLGNWPPPFGIVLVVDRLSAMMIALTTALSLLAALAAIPGADTQGRHFHTLFQLQIAGLNGAFLTGDLFNLFVFFEILLLASYALLVHGGGLERTRAALAYAIVNLIGSALFLIALGLVYGTLGTLTMADLALVLPKVAEADQALVRTALALLAVVFVLKAALLPLGLWLPRVYTSALLPVAVLFVIMTKVGVYALLRVATIGLAAAPFTLDLLDPWLPWLAIGTIALGSLGALAARRFAGVIANLVLISSGTLLLGVASGSTSARAALLFYLVHTTIVTGALFLLTDALSRDRGTLADMVVKGPQLNTTLALGAAFLVLGVAASGVPPLSGFLAKLMLLQSIRDTSTGLAAWIAVLMSGLVVALVMARAASVFFWEPGRASERAEIAPPVTGIPRDTAMGLRIALVLLVPATLLLTLAAGPVSGYTRAAAEQLAAREAYVAVLLSRQPPIERMRRP